MNKKNLNNSLFCQLTKCLSVCLVAVVAFLTSGLTFADESTRVEKTRITLGGKFRSLNWKGQNKSTEISEFETDTSSLSISASIQQKAWYAGMRFTGGEYDFSDGIPAIEPNITDGANGSGQVGRSEFDLVFGYYFWPRVSIFGGVKALTHEFEEQNHKLGFNGVSLGVSGYYPFSDLWWLYGSLAFTNLNIKHEDDDLGSSNGSAAEIGFIYIINSRSRFTASLIGQSQNNKYDNGDDQTHNLGGIGFGYSHSLSFF